MDARELTEKYHKMNKQIAELQNQVKKLEDLVNKQNVWINDAKIDLAMLQGKKMSDVKDL